MCIRDSFLSSVRSGVAVPTIGPGLTCKNHLRTQVISIEPDARETTAVIVIAPDRHLYLLVQHAPLERRARGFATRLANLGGVNAINAKSARRASGVGLHPKRVAIRDVQNLADKALLRRGVTCQQKNG